MDKLKQLLVSPQANVRDAMRVIDEFAHRAVLVADENRKLLGIVSDGDIRRWILKNGGLESMVTAVMNAAPMVLSQHADADTARKIMLEHKIEVLPVVGEDGLLLSAYLWLDLFGNKTASLSQLDNPVVIMAGGYGTRLYPYTKILPKPLIPIGEKPIIEHIIDRFCAQGCDDFYLTVNYRAGMIRAYFAEQEADYSVHFIEEGKPLGTGGSLHLLHGVLDRTFFVSNCDILVEADYADILRHHRQKGYRLTVVASLKHYTVPYGVMELNESEQLQSTREKPELTWLVNTGMYVLEPEALADIPRDTFFHITDLINHYLENGIPVGIYPVSEKAWMDMGQIDEMREMMRRMGV